VFFLLTIIVAIVTHTALSDDLQYTDGVIGPLIVHPTAGNPPAIPAYDEEIIIQLSDWYHQLANTYLNTFLSVSDTFFSRHIYADQEVFVSLKALMAFQVPNRFLIQE